MGLVYVDSFKRGWTQNPATSWTARQSCCRCSAALSSRIIAMGIAAVATENLEVQLGAE
jgi:hypothetical protein